MTAPNPRDFAVVIGINEYDDNNKNLTSPVDDAKAIVKWLIDHSGGGLDPKNCLHLYGYSEIDGKKASQEAIEDLLIKAREFAKSLKTSDSSARRLYYYFSGHGISGGTDVLMCHALWSKHRPNANLNSDNIDKDYINPCTHFEESVFWLDCCRSLSLTTQPGSLQIGCTIPRDNANTQKTMMAFATLDNTEAFEALSDQSSQSVFTQALVAGLRHATNDLGRVTWRSLAKYLEEYVPSIAEADNRSQTPVIHFPRLKQSSDPILCEGSADIAVTIVFNRGSGDVEIVNSKFDAVAIHNLADGNLSLNFELGKYLALAGSESATFEINGVKEEVYVNF